MIGTRSVGGGPSTLLLMREQMVERRRWITHRQFLEDWALSKLSLGMNLVAPSILLLAPEGAVLGVPAWQLALAAIAAALTLQGKAHPGLLVAAGALVGVAPGR